MRKPGQSAGFFYVFKKINKYCNQRLSVSCGGGVLEKKRQINYYSAGLPICAVQRLFPGCSKQRCGVISERQ